MVWIVPFVCSFALGMIVVITWTGNRNTLRQADCIIVPGALVRSDGMPGRMLAARIANAARLYREGWAAAIIFTGGRGESGAIESEAARDVALEMGLPADRLFVETRSHTTYENFLHAREVMREHGWRSCLISTDPFHVLRCVTIARDLGLRASGAPAFSSPGYTNLDVRVYYTLRECAGFVRYAMQRMGTTAR